MNITSAASVFLTEGIMIKAPRFSRAARGDRRADHPVAEHRLLGEDGTFLGRIDEASEPPVFGPMEPTVYLQRGLSPAETVPTPRDTRRRPSGTSAPREEDVKR